MRKSDFFYLAACIFLAPLVSNGTAFVVAAVFFALSIIEYRKEQLTPDDTLSTK